MRALLGEPGFDKMHITPRQPIDQRELAAAHGLRFVLADAEVLRQAEQKLGAGERLPIAEQVQEGE